MALSSECMGNLIPQDTRWKFLYVSHTVLMPTRGQLARFRVGNLTGYGCAIRIGGGVAWGDWPICAIWRAKQNARRSVP